MTKEKLFEYSVEITKSFCLGGKISTSPEVVFENIFKKLKTIAEDEKIIKEGNKTGII